MYRAQLTELLTRYGPIHEVWFDGANGEGPNGKRQVYDWPATFALVRRLQPDAVIFSDAGPDVRWIGNERGSAGDPNWSTIDPTAVPYPGIDAPGVIEALQHGHPRRLGHATHVFDDPRLVETLLERQIHLEMCPTSNLLTGSIAGIEDHPIRRAFDLGLNVGLNTDDPLPAQNPIAIVDKFADKHGNRTLAQAYADFHYSEAGQEIAAQHFLRPTLDSVAAKYKTQFKELTLFTVDETFGGWAKAQKTHFADGGMFDQIYQK
jgi:hypothetical protein